MALSFKGWLGWFGWGDSAEPSGFASGSTSFTLSAQAQATAIGQLSGSAQISFEATGELGDGVVTQVDASGSASIAFSAYGLLTDALATVDSGGWIGGSATKRPSVQRELPALFLPPLPELPPEPVAPAKRIEPDYKQNEPVAHAGNAQAATEFVSNLLANLPALPPEDDSTEAASDASAPISVTLQPKETYAAQTLETIQAQQEQQAQKAAMLKRQDDELALIMILLEAA